MKIKLAINDLGDTTISYPVNAQQLVDEVLTCGAGAIIDINDGQIHWDRAEDETTEEFWNFVQAREAAEKMAKIRWSKDKMSKEERSRYFQELSSKRKNPGRKKKSRLICF